MDVFAVAEKHMSWLATRQAITANNMANADTPGFKASEIVSFRNEMQSVAARMTRNNSSHLQATQDVGSEFGSRFQKNAETTLSGNDVVIEKEMRTAGENARLYSFDIGLLKSFHRMILASVKS
jgi:flagellar basal-body rod protein FlgB